MNQESAPLRSVIAIDGGAATGKTTTAAAVAARLGFCYVDSGAIYRALALALFHLGVRSAGDQGIGSLLPGLGVTVEPSPAGFVVRLGGASVGAEIRSPEITELASHLAMRSDVRALVRDLVRDAARRGPLVVEGRDIGTVVFPEARLKIFLRADLAVRAARRQLDLERQGRRVNLDAVAAELVERDQRDSTRAESPLRRAADAVELDTTSLTVEEQVNAIVAIYRSRAGEEPVR